MQIVAPTGLSRDTLAKTNPLAVHDSPVADVVFDQKRSFSVRTVEVRTRLFHLIFANLAEITRSPDGYSLY